MRWTPPEYSSVNEVADSSRIWLPDHHEHSRYFSRTSHRTVPQYSPWLSSPDARSDSDHTAGLRIIRTNAGYWNVFSGTLSFVKHLILFNSDIPTRKFAELIPGSPNIERLTCYFVIDGQISRSSFDYLLTTIATRSTNSEPGWHKLNTIALSEYGKEEAGSVEWLTRLSDLQQIGYPIRALMMPRNWVDEEDVIRFEEHC